MLAHPHHVPGLFDCVKKVDDANAVVIPYGTDDNGNQIVDPPVTQTPAIPPVPTPGAGTGSGPDPNAALKPSWAGGPGPGVVARMAWSCDALVSVAKSPTLPEPRQCGTNTSIAF